MKAVSLAPVSEALLDAEAISRFRTGYLNLFGAPGDDPLYATISEGARRQGMEQWLPLFYETLDTLFDYLPDQAQVFLDNQVETARGERWDLIADAYEARGRGGAGQGRGGGQSGLAAETALYGCGRLEPGAGGPRRAAVYAVLQRWRGPPGGGWAGPLRPSGLRTASTCSRRWPITPRR